METTAHETNEINAVSALSSGIISSRNDKREESILHKYFRQG